MHTNEHIDDDTRRLAGIKFEDQPPTCGTCVHYNPQDYGGPATGLAWCMRNDPLLAFVRAGDSCDHHATLDANDNVVLTKHVYEPPRYPREVLDEDDDNGTMPGNVAELREAVVGRRIVSAEQHGRNDEKFVLTLDDGRKVEMHNTDDCCAYTDLNAFLLHPESVDHVIIGVGTTGEYTTWHIYADLGDILQLTVGWSAGNPFYYGYGFDIRVIDPEVPA